MRTFSVPKIMVAFCLASLTAVAGPVNVSYTVSGASGAYILDFTVTNNMIGLLDQDVYFFGVKLSGPGIVGSPAGYDPTVWPTWSNAPYGGSSSVYNNNLIILGIYTGLLPCNSFSGFYV